MGIGLDPWVEPPERRRSRRPRRGSSPSTGSGDPAPKDTIFSWIAGSRPVLSGLFYLRDIRSNLDVTPESALALIRGLGEYPDSLLGQIPDRARRAPFRDDGGEIAAD